MIPAILRVQREGKDIINTDCVVVGYVSEGAVVLSPENGSFIVVPFAAVKAKIGNASGIEIAKPGLVVSD